MARRFGLRPSRLATRIHHRDQEVKDQGKTYTYPQPTITASDSTPGLVFSRRGGLVLLRRGHLRKHYGLPKLLAQLGLARSSYFYHRTRAAAGDKYVQVRQFITEIFESNHRCYGYCRLQASLTRQDVAISEKVVQRLMKQESLVVPKSRKRRYASYLGALSPIEYRLSLGLAA